MLHLAVDRVSLGERSSNVRSARQSLGALRNCGLQAIYVGELSVIERQRERWRQGERERSVEIKREEMKREGRWSERGDEERGEMEWERKGERMRRGREMEWERQREGGEMEWERRGEAGEMEWER